MTEKKHETKQDAYGTFVKELAKVKERRWMAALFYVDDDNKIRLFRTTSNFDKNDFPICVNELRTHCINEVFPPQGFSPPGLPRAELGQQRIKLMGIKNEEN